MWMCNKCSCNSVSKIFWLWFNVLLITVLFCSRRPSIQMLELWQILHTKMFIRVPLQESPWGIIQLCLQGTPVKDVRLWGLWSYNTRPWAILCSSKRETSTQSSSSQMLRQETVQIWWETGYEPRYGARYWWRRSEVIIVEGDFNAVLKSKLKRCDMCIFICILIKMVG